MLECIEQAKENSLETTKLNFEDWLALDSILHESEVIDIKIGTDWHTWTSKEKEMEQFLDERSIEWPKNKNLGSQYIAYQLIENGYISTLSPKAEAGTLWNHWKRKYGERLGRYAPIWKTLPRTKTSGYVYILKSGPYYKIGRTKNITKRFPQIYIHLPFETRLICIFYSKNMHQTERDMHKWYSEYRTNGEWFSLPDNEISELASMQPCIYNLFERLNLEIEANNEQ
jgi:hypothetical protein